MDSWVLQPTTLPHGLLTRIFYQRDELYIIIIVYQTDINVQISTTFILATLKQKNIF